MSIDRATIKVGDELIKIAIANSNNIVPIGSKCIVIKVTFTCICVKYADKENNRRLGGAIDYYWKEAEPMFAYENPPVVPEPVTPCYLEIID